MTVVMYGTKREKSHLARVKCNCDYTRFPVTQRVRYYITVALRTLGAHVAHNLRFIFHESIRAPARIRNGSAPIGYSMYAKEDLQCQIYGTSISTLCSS